MSRVTFEINDLLLEKLNTSLEIQNENIDQAFSRFAEEYIMAAYQKLDKYLNELNAVDKTSSTDGALPYYVANDLKGVRRISIWARKPEQYNHKIIRAFFQLEKENKTVKLSDLQRRCRDNENHPEVYVPTFSNNFAQMKFDEGKSHGKIFEEEFGVVTIWGKAKHELEAHKHFFE